MIYLAGCCSKEKRNFMKKIAKHLRNNGEEVYCPFEFKITDVDPWSLTQEDWSKRVFEADVEAINKADIVIFISEGRLSTAGTNWEQGYAYALNKKIYVLQHIGEETSLMTYGGCTKFKNTNKRNIYKDIDEMLYTDVVYTKCKTHLT